MQCSRCRRPAIIFQRYSGLHLCHDHFIADFEAKAKRTIRKRRYITPGDRIGVALSGGKDSSALLHFMKKLAGPRTDLELVAITMDEGIRGYRDTAVAARIAQDEGVPHIIASFKDEMQVTMDEIVAQKGDTLSCSYCGVLRRQCLNRVARMHGITKLALGFNLDDEAQSVLMNVLRGDSVRLLRGMQPVEGMIPRIKPFKYIPEREVALYAYLHVNRFETGRCPYAHNALRADVRALLNNYAWRHPSARYAVVNLGEELSALGSRQGDSWHTCPDCGEPCGAVCRSCQIRLEVGNDPG